VKLTRSDTSTSGCLVGRGCAVSNADEGSARGASARRLRRASIRQDRSVHSLSRRAFLVASGSLLVAAACGSDDSGDSDGGTAGAPEDLTAGKVSIDPYVSSDPQRLAFVVFENDGDFAGGAAATVAFKAPGQASFATPMPAALHTAGLPDKRGVYVVETPLPRAGVWYSQVGIDGEELEVPFEVPETSLVVTPGQAAPRAPSPTLADPLGVDPICTQDPPCPLHAVSLAHTVGSGRPVAVMFATPARCQTMYCGPVLTQLLDVMEPYRDRIEFVHVEIYRNATSDELVPTVEAWGLPGEPWLFGLDGAGNVVGRLDGAFASDEVTALLDRL
jgi:hypothetical protein